MFFFYVLVIIQGDIINEYRNDKLTANKDITMHLVSKYAVTE